MGKEDPQVTAAARRYILVALLQRLERVSPGLLAELQSGIAGDLQAMAANGNQSIDIEAVVSEVQRIVRIGNAP